MAGDDIRRRVIVRGQVQGVGFRMSTLEEARRRSVSGSVSNLADGSVEVQVEGAESAVAAMLEWLNDGPEWARVDSVEVSEQPTTGKTGFRVE